MRFAHPKMLWLLAVAITLLVAFLFWSRRRKRALIGQFVQSRLLAQLTVGISARREVTKLALLVMAVGLTFIALARPQWGFAWEEVRQKGLDVVVAIDTSRSMVATDVAPNRLARAKLAALDLLKEAKGDRFGLVAFAGTAFLQCPLTLDDHAFQESLNSLEPGIIPQGGSSLAEAVRASLGAFQREEGNFKVLVLFSDGEDHEEGALEAARAAASEGLRIYTVGVGTASGELLRLRTQAGGEDWVRDEAGNVVKSRLNEALLKQMAEVSGGFYLPLRGASAMETLYRDGLAPLPKAERESRMMQNFFERFQWPLGLALLLLILEFLLPARSREPRGKAAPQLRAPSIGQAMVRLLLAGLLGAQLAQASSSSALNHFRQGRYSQAFEEYRRLSKAHPDDHRYAFNAGAAAYRAGEFQSAITEFETATRSLDVPMQQQAFYNLGNALTRDGEKAEQLDQKEAAWNRAVQSFETATKLDPKDTDARNNLDYVKKLLEELKQQKQQQQQQQQNDPNQNKDSDEKKENPEGKENKQNQGQSKDQKQNKGKEQDSKDPSGKDSQNNNESSQQKQQTQARQPDPKKPNPKQDGKKDQPDKKEQNAANTPKPGQESPGKEQQSQAGTSGQPQPGSQGEAGETAQGQPQSAQAIMSPAQAMKLLENQKGEERTFLFLPPGRKEKPDRSIKDW